MAWETLGEGEGEGGVRGAGGGAFRLSVYSTACKSMEIDPSNEQDMIEYTKTDSADWKTVSDVLCASQRHDVIVSHITVISINPSHKRLNAKPPKP